MTDIWHWQPERVRALLRARGYDIDPVGNRYGDDSISARRERAGQAQLFAIDRGGRFRAEVTAATGETRRTSSLGAAPVVIITQTHRVMTVTGSLPDLNHLPLVLHHLDTQL